MDPVLTSQLEYEALDAPQSNLLFSGGKSELFTNTSTYDSSYSQGFLTGTQLTVGFDNQRVTTNDPLTSVSPAITTSSERR